MRKAETRKGDKGRSCISERKKLYQRSFCDERDRRRRVTGMSIG
jgi:hypothetical protein